jgi:two-component system, cell cycle sensor histidine kinase and response regulator CckA
MNSLDSTTMRHTVRSISKNLTISLIVVIVFISLAFISIYYFQFSKREKERLEHTADEYINSVASTLEIPLWDMDRENMITVCNFYYRNNAVVALKLVGVSGEVMYDNINPSTIGEADLVERSRGIFHNGEPIGNVTLALSPLQSKEAKQELLKVSLAALLISVVGLIFSTGFLLKKYLREPMRFLHTIAQSYAQGDYHPHPEGTSYREFEPFVSVLVEMGETIESQMNELHRAESALKNHRDHLEETVARRTRELKRSNRELQNEIQDRRMAQEELRAHQQRLEAILRASPVGIGLAVDRQLSWTNQTFYQMVGYERDSLRGRSTRIFYKDDAEYERVGKALYSPISRPEIAFVETQWVRRDGTVFDCIVRSCPLDKNDPSKGIIFAVADISEAKRLENKLQRAEKMEAIGTLAGGVAHDLNNILSGIVSYPEILLMDLPAGSPLRNPLLTMQKSGERAVEIVQDLLTMARRGVSVTEVVNLNRTIAEQLSSPEMAKLKSFHQNVKITTVLAEDLLNVKGSATHLSKSIMNLISNAAEAMPDGGTITVSTGNIYLDTPVKSYEHIEEGDYVKLSIADTGTGIGKKDREKIFEPFYTKKKMGRSGTGLGMSVVWGTVKDHSGYIDVQSVEGKGTIFTLYLPVTREELKEAEPGMSIEELKGQGERILVVDDVQEQREIATAILTTLGYHVASVPCGEKAVEHMNHHATDLLVLDMIMDPGIDGLDTYKKIVELHPAQKAIITSGFSRTDRVKEVQRLGAGQYLKKPYTLSKLGLAVKEELGLAG